MQLRQAVIDELAQRIDRARADEALFRRPGRPLQRVAVEALEGKDSRELALRIAWSLFPGYRKPDYWETDEPDEPLTALTVIGKLNQLHAGHRNVGAWLLDLAVGTGLATLKSGRRGRDEHRAPTQVEPAQALRHALLLEIEDELPAVLREPSQEPAQVKPNDGAGADDPESIPSPLALDAARAVHETKWRVNTALLTLVAKVGFDEEEGLRRELEATIPQCKYPKRRQPKEVYARQRRKGGPKIEARRRARKLKIELEKIERNKQLIEIATRRAYHFPDGFYFPVSFDFRGRIFQDDTALQYTSGSDLARALLEFADGKRLSELDETDRYYAQRGLLMHMYRCYGGGGDQDQTDNDDGHENARGWLDKHEHEIIASVADPVTHTFWRRGKAKTKFRFLAAAHAWVHGIVGPGELHIPVVFDATNSGLQHCSLLLRDAVTARSANLSKEPLHQDFYAVIAKQLNMQRDDAKKIIVPLLYGSTKARAAQRDKVWAAMSEVEKLYAWLTAFAMAAVEQNVGLRWMTPSGFHVELHTRARVSRPDLSFDVAGLPNIKNNRLQLEATGPALHTFRRFSDKTGKELKPPMAAGLAPHFVHSLDAALLTRIITAEKWMKSGSRNPLPISDWAVAHDSVGVPAWRWHELLQRAGEQMYHVHSDDTLRESWVRPYPIHPVPLPGRRCKLRDVPEIDTRNPHAWR